MYGRETMQTAQMLLVAYVAKHGTMPTPANVTDAYNAAECVASEAMKREETWDKRERAHDEARRKRRPEVTT